MAREHAQGCFVQVGATRDGLDPYLQPARRRGLRAVLVETPDYLGWRRQLGRQPFDLEVPVEHPADPLAVERALAEVRCGAALVLPGFERYVGSAYALAQWLGVPPWRAGAAHFLPPDKWDQRRRLLSRAPGVAQPRHVLLTGAGGADLPGLRPPMVVKPCDGGGGLGVFLAQDRDAVAAALARLAGLRNYDGSPFSRVMAEQYVAGTEISLQGLARGGEAVVLTVCEKFITREPAGAGLLGFREAGHVASPGGQADPALWRLARRCADAFGFCSGPFHIDLVRRDGRWFFLEMGFRLSGGGLARLVGLAAGLDWGELSLAQYLGEPAPLVAPEGRVVGQIMATTADELERALRLRAAGHDVTVEPIAPPPALPEGRLASDRLRHTGFAGRVLASGGSVAEVKDLLRRCAPARLGHPEEGALRACAG